MRVWARLARAAARSGALCAVCRNSGEANRKLFEATVAAVITGLPLREVAEAMRASRLELDAAEAIDNVEGFLERQADDRTVTACTGRWPTSRKGEDPERARSRSAAIARRRARVRNRPRPHTRGAHDRGLLPGQPANRGSPHCRRQRSPARLITGAASTRGASSWRLDGPRDGRRRRAGRLYRTRTSALPGWDRVVPVSNVSWVVVAATRP
jgi:hypothetical protein